VLRCEEDAPRLAYLQLAPGLAFVAFPASVEPLPVWRGREMQPGDIMFHSRGERLHQSTSGPSVWNVIAMDPAQLERYGRALSGRPFSSPPEGRTLQLPGRLANRLPRLHAQICRLAQTKSKMLSHSEVARAIEQSLIQALVTCLTTARARTDGMDGRAQFGRARRECQLRGGIPVGGRGAPRSGGDWPPAAVDVPAGRSCQRGAPANDLRARAFRPDRDPRPNGNVPDWRPLLAALAAETDVQWVAGPRYVPSWVHELGITIVEAPRETPEIHTVSCASPRHEALEALRWARELIATGVPGRRTSRSPRPLPKNGTIISWP